MQTIAFVTFSKKIFYFIPNFKRITASQNFAHSFCLAIEKRKTYADNSWHRYYGKDDPRNPAVIADNVGDNVGDVAGMGADLYESYCGSILSTAALGVAAYAALGMSQSVQLNALFLPILLAAVGIVASIWGIFLVKTDEKTFRMAHEADMAARPQTAAAEPAQEADISFFTGKVETIDLLDEIIADYNASPTA